MVIELVLATDMKQHFAIVSQFQSKVRPPGRVTTHSVTVHSLPVAACWMEG